MAQPESVQRVRIYLSRDDQWQGRPRYLALLEELQRAGATGATVLLGLAGFGPSQRTATAIVDRPEARQPLVLEWVDHAERVARLLPVIDPLLDQALVTVEAVPIYRATLRARGPFGNDRTAGDLMRQPAPVVQATTPLGVAIMLLASEGLGALPVVDEQGHLAGLLTPQDLAWRAGLRLPLNLLALLTPAEREAILGPLSLRMTGEVMRAEPHSVSASTAVVQALVTMVEWGYPHVPVVDRSGLVVGLLGQEQVLHEVAEQSASASQAGAVRDAEPPPSVSLVMQTATHAFPVSRSLALAIAQLLSDPAQALLVVDAAGRLQGQLSLASVLPTLPHNERAVLLAALQRDPPPPATALPGPDRGLQEALERTVSTISPQATVFDAVRQLTSGGHARLAVVNEDRQLLGIIARGGLIRALLQQSE
ncbi:MAG: DUF190 domain-containing protein [Oscillochloridaceae bacterium umkhey_bin13]